MDRVIVTRPIIGICLMQVCAAQDATDEEILEVCNRENPAGTENGWSEVLRVADESNMFKGANKLPVQCADHADRLHFMVLC